MIVYPGDASLLANEGQVESLVRPSSPADPLPSLELHPEPILEYGRRRWLKWLGSLISLVVLAAALWRWRELDRGQLADLLPDSAFFWLAFLAYYFLGPAADWVIFRRLWKLPPSGIVPLLRKKVSNELVLGYIGEVHFYIWARRHTHLTTAPFGAIKDVAIMSAVAGNAITLLMLAAGAPLLGALVDQVHLDLSQRTLALSIGFVAFTSLLVLVLRRHVLSLPRRELWFVLAVHCARIVLGVGLLALMWHIALPEVALLWWILLSLLRQLVTRLPFVPNKDVVFAGLAILMVGEDARIAGLMALVAGIVLVAHLIIGATLAVSDLLRQDGAA